MSYQYYIIFKNQWARSMPLVVTNKVYEKEFEDSDNDFTRYMRNLIDQGDIEDAAYMVEPLEDDRGCGYVMPDDWKHSMVDGFASNIDIDDLEQYIGEIGIRKAFRLADDCGFYDEDDYKKALTTEEGLRRLFYAILYGLIDINENSSSIGDPYIRTYETNDEYVDAIREAEEEEEGTEEEETEDEDEEEQDVALISGSVASAA